MSVTMIIIQMHYLLFQLKVIELFEVISCIDAAHGDAIPIENDVYRHISLLVYSQPLIIQKYR